MKALAANTATLIISKVNVDRIVTITSDQTTACRLSLSKVDLQTDQTFGFSFSSVSPLNIFLPAGQELFAISTGTPNISWAPIKKGTGSNVVELV
ncbi:MAG: hypothetical protein PHH85_01630 [Candidatus Methanoperedens sp.]|nr:hypothetical protein [Candidatus Methanoperedens sp.]